MIENKFRFLSLSNIPLKPLMCKIDMPAVTRIQTWVTTDTMWDPKHGQEARSENTPAILKKYL